MKSLWTDAVHDFDDIAERPPYLLSPPIVVSFVVLLMALALFTLNKNGSLFSFVTNSMNRMMAGEDDAVKAIYQSVLSIAEEHPALKSALIDSRGVELSLQSDDFFESGRADLKPSARTELLGTLEALTDMPTLFTVSVEGHTDSTPVKVWRHRYPSNWELSAFRAAAVVRLFEEAGFPAERLSLAGFGSQRLKKTERDPAGQDIAASKAFNRRITLRLFPVKAADKD